MPYLILDQKCPKNASSGEISVLSLPFLHSPWRSKTITLMINVERELDRYLTLLRNKIHDKGFTQLEVQEALSWGRSYISQLLTKQKCLRLEQVLSILRVIGVDAHEFFAELYGGAALLGGGQRPSGSDDDLRHQFERMQALLGGLTKLLTEKRLITSRELSAAIQVAEAEPTEPN